MCNYFPNSDFNVLRKPSSIVNGGLKPEPIALLESNCVTAQNFLTRTELMGNFFRVAQASTSKPYPPNIPNQ